MAIFQFQHSIEGFEPLTVVDPSDWEGWRMLEAVAPIGEAWIPPTVRFFEPGEAGFASRGSQRTDTDTPWLNGTLACVISHRFAGRLSDILLRYGKFLPLKSAEGNFYIYHCLNQLDNALDLERSEGSRAGDGRMLSLKKPVFRPEAVRSQDIFRVAKPSPYTLFVSDRFVERANASGLVGLNFVPVWAEESVDETASGFVPPSRTVRRATGVSPLPKKAAKVIPQAVAQGEQLAEVDLAYTPSAEVVQKIHTLIDVNGSRRDQSFADASLLAATLGTLWGEVICREFGWEWAWVRQGDAESAGIASPTRSHVVFPQPYFYNLLARRGRGPTSLELYSMIKSGTLPTAEPDSCLVLA